MHLFCLCAMFLFHGSFVLICSVLFYGLLLAMLAERLCISESGVCVAGWLFGG